MEGLPAPLRTIHDEVHGHAWPQPALDALRPAWAAHLARARRLIRHLRVEDEGEGLYLGQLSPGCRACKDGTWDCIFVTMACNLDCAFCYSPQAIPRAFSGSQMGRTPEEIAANHERTGITGISFSGGEPFLQPDRLFAWVEWFTSRFPDRYYWIYTNGLLAEKEKLQRLAALGIDEIRFNLAASGYDHPQVLENLSAAARCLPRVTVEIPAIPEQGEKLMACLADWSARGVRFLNLHELLYEPGSKSASMPGARQSFVTPDGHRSALHPASRDLTLAVMQRVQDERLPLAVNDCALQSKLRQLRGRRRCLAPLTRAPHERMLDGSFLESYCAYRGSDLFFFRPDSLAEMQAHYPGYTFVRLVRTAPLSVGDPGRWVAIEHHRP